MSRTALASALLVPFVIVACEQPPPEPAQARPAPKPSATSVEVPAATTTLAEPTASARPPEPAPSKDLPAPEDVATPPKDARKTASGLVTKVLAPGKGKDKPRLEDRVKVHYTGWTKDGKMFDSSVARNEPATFGVSGVIKGWTEALQLMVVGEKRRLWIPAELAYGDNPGMGAPAGQLTFDVELLEILPAPKPWPVPPDVKEAPKDAKKTASGLAYKWLVKGKGTRKPTATDRVTVHYTGWTPDGKEFDSSVKRGEPATFALNRVIKGWTEGVQMMVEGDRMRFWIPSDLAYGDKPTRPGAPAGPLVFDVELIGISGGAR